MQTRMRMIAAGAVVALLTGTAGAAAASTGGTASPAASASSSAQKPPPGKGGNPGYKQPPLAVLAAKLHVSLPKLESALADAKMTIGSLGVAPTDPKVIAVVQHDLGITSAQAKWLVDTVFGNAGQPGGPGGKGGQGNGGQGVPEQLVIQTFANVLHISESRAAQAVAQIEHMSRETALTDPQFEALAASLHLTPQQLVNAIDQVKQDLAAYSQSSSSSSKS
jgi:hypothetical protein